MSLTRKGTKFPHGGSLGLLCGSDVDMSHPGTTKREHVAYIIISFRISCRKLSQLRSCPSWGSPHQLLNEGRTLGSKHFRSPQDTHSRIPCQDGQDLVGPAFSVCPIFFNSLHFPDFDSYKHLEPHTVSQHLLPENPTYNIYLCGIME